MNTTATFVRLTDPAAIAARIHLAHQQRRDAVSRAYRRALRLAEYHAWLAIEPRASNTPAAEQARGWLGGWGL
jgi:hypothetical protein